jgi:hypothetical protein
VTRRAERSAASALRSSFEASSSIKISEPFAYIGRVAQQTRRAASEQGLGVRMKAAKWWLRIIGTLYLLEGIGLTAMALADPAGFAALWAVAPVGSIEALGVRAALIGGLPGVLTWVLLGALMWIYSGAPARARVLIVVVAAWELLVWIPVDAISSLQIFDTGRVVLSAIHLVIGVSGIVILRRLPAG